MYYKLPRRKDVKWEATSWTGTRTNFHYHRATKHAASVFIKTQYDNCMQKFLYNGTYDF